MRYQLTELAEVSLERFGGLLRSLREERGLSLREVEERIEALTKRWGIEHSATSFSHLAKIERGEFDVRVSTLIALAFTYGQRPETFLDACLPADYGLSALSTLRPPNSTVLSGEGSAYQKIEKAAVAAVNADPPERTEVLGERELPGNRYRQAIVGTKDRAVYPILRPGSILTVDTHKRAIVPPSQWTSELDRPIYLLYTREGYICGWCQLNKRRTILYVVSHVMEKLNVLPLAYGTDVEVVGQVVGVTVSLGRGREGS